MRAILMLILVAPLATAQEPADGFYYLADAGAERVASDGSIVRLGEPVALRPTSVNLEVLDNSGTAFHLGLLVPGDGASARWLVLVVGGQAHRQHGRGTAGEDSSLVFVVAGGAAADRVAKHFGITVPRRVHPRHALRARFEPTRPRVGPRGAVEVTIHLENCGDKPLAFMNGHRSGGSRNNQLAFVARNGGRPVPDIGDADSSGGRVEMIRLAPGEVFRLAVDVRAWFALDQVGSYRLLGSYYLEIVDPSDWTRTLWEDYATADFTIEVAER